jgi:multicomponent Na+:H+ antiporter subunit D
VIEMDLFILDVKLVPIRLDGMAGVLATALAGIGILSLLFSRGRHSAAYSIWLVLFVASSMMAVLAGDFVTLLISWEMMSVASYLLLTDSARGAARAAGYRFILMQIAGGAALFLAVLLQYRSTGHLAVGPVAEEALPLFLLACGIKVGLFPLHVWLTDTYPKVHCDASIILAACTTKVGVYVMARTMQGSPLVWMGAFMALFGVAAALLQRNARSLLSYHVLSQVGYMMAALGAGTALGRNAALFHAVNNIAFKSLLFMVVGAVFWRTGTDDLAELGGLARRMPATMLFALTASLAISGAPFLNGYASKTLIHTALAGKGHSAVRWALTIASAGTFLSFSKFFYYVFLRENPRKHGPAEVPLPMLLAMGTAAAFCGAAGLYPNIVTRHLPLDLSLGFDHLQWAGIGKTLACGVVGIGGFFFLRNVLPLPKRDRLDLMPLYRAGGRLYERISEKLAAVHGQDVQMELACVLGIFVMLFFALHYLL